MIKELDQTNAHATTRGIRADESYFEKLLRYIPGDIVAGYVTSMESSSEKQATRQFFNGLYSEHC